MIKFNCREHKVFLAISDLVKYDKEGREEVVSRSHVVMDQYLTRTQVALCHFIIVKLPNGRFQIVKNRFDKIEVNWLSRSRRNLFETEFVTDEMIGLMLLAKKQAESL